MKKLYTILAVSILYFANAQTITFNGCHNLFDNTDYIFNKDGTDTQGKNIYITTPVDGEQPCGGLGTCEFKIQWNNTLTRWEFLADDGNGDFANPYLIYYSTKGNNSVNIPPNANIGAWIENIAVTDSQCGGNLTTTNSTMTGDVQDTVLGAIDLSKLKIQIYPNPVVDIINISGVDNASHIAIYNINGQLVRVINFTSKLDISNLSTGTYLIRVSDKSGANHDIKIIKK